jgi:hypothetical protein
MKTNGSSRVLKYPELVGGLIPILLKCLELMVPWFWIFHKTQKKEKKVGLWKIKEQHNTLLFSLIFS